MKCEKCGKNEANMYYKESINGQTREMHLCSACANEMNLDSQFHQAFADMKSGFGSFFDSSFPSLFGNGFTPLLSSMMDTAPFGILPDTERRCPTCGMTLRDLRRNGRAGCPDCYHTFSDVLNPYIHRVQGADSHIGSAPQSEQATRPKKCVLDNLKEKLQDAIKSENYEEAARLRDEIRRQEGE